VAGGHAQRQAALEPTVGLYRRFLKAAPPDILTTIFTTTLSGLIGLFVKAPSSS